MQDADAAAPTIAEQIAALPPKGVGEIGDLVVQPESKHKVTGTVLHEAAVTRWCTGPAVGSTRSWPPACLPRGHKLGLVR